MDSIWVKNSANAFWLAASRNMERNADQFQDLLVPGVVCAAFSIELGIKSLLFTTGHVPRTHNLSTLFLKLPETTQGRIVAQCSDTREAFDNSLCEIANVFEEWRYVYESDSPHLNIGFLFELAAAVSVAVNGPAP